MNSSPDGAPNFCGPHEGRELELLASGIKPLAMFVEPLPAEPESFDEQKFDVLLNGRVLVKGARIESITTPDGDLGQVRRVLYALPSETWRIPAMLLVHDVYSSRGPGFSPDREDHRPVAWV
jgi:hypothetical protein